MKITDILIRNNFAVSTNEAKRLVKQGGVKINDNVLIIREGDDVNIDLMRGDKIQVGKKSVTIQ